MVDGSKPLPGGTILGTTVTNPEEFVSNMAKVMEHTSTIANLLARKAEAAGTKEGEIQIHGQEGVEKIDGKEEGCEKGGEEGLIAAQVAVPN